MVLVHTSKIFVISIGVLFCLIQPSYQTTYTCNTTSVCGCSSNPVSITRIVGGESAGTSTWDWAVSISIAGTYLCGGSILSSSWVITAAHCMAGATASQVIVYGGSNTRFSGQSRTATAITTHASYSSSTKINDISIIQLSTPFTISSASPICIPNVNASTLAAGEWPTAGTYIMAVGWGTTSESGSTSSTLRQVTVQAIAATDSMCRTVINNQQMQFCAGVSGGGKDTCQGDSGGPLMLYTKSGQWVLVGLTSYGIGCARAAYAGVYTRVAYYQSWIATVTGGAYYNVTSIEADTVSSSSISLYSKLESLVYCLLLPFLQLIFVQLGLPR